MILGRNNSKALRHWRGSPRASGAFTLIEIMVVVGIMAIILAIGIPSVYQQMHKDSMRQAVADVCEACNQARGRAVLDGIPVALRIRPTDRTINVVPGSAPAKERSLEANKEAVEHHSGGGGGGNVFSMKFSDHIIIEFVGVNLVPDLQLTEEVDCMFYPNGTSDELVILLRSDLGEIRQITTEVVTGIPDVEVKH
jgi:prepilin-type N-terminal cleavage/methylation domain-containing protein